MTEEELEEMSKEELLGIIKAQRFEIERLHSIIKEVREYINNHQLVFEMSSKKQIAYWFDMFYKELLEILDKVGDSSNE